MHVPGALVDAVSQRQAVLFAGAGISMDAVRVSAADVRDAVGAKIRLDFPSYDPQTRTIEDACDEYVALNDRQGLVNQLAALIPKTAEPLESHLAAVRTFRFIVTTNWDLLFEAAYRQIGQDYQVLADEADAPNFNYDQHNLLKMHGTADRPLTLVATTDDYEGYADTHPQLLEHLTDVLHNNVVLFVGYGLRDEHVRRLLSKLRRIRGQWARKAYAVGFYDEVRSRLLASRGIETIDADAAEFLPELARRAGV